MGNRAISRNLVALAVVATMLVAAACGSDGGGGASSDSSMTATPVAGVALPDAGPCDASRAKIHLGQITTVESPVLTSEEQAEGALAAVEAFNARGGVDGYCMDLTICDDRADVTQAADCARQFANGDIVATLHDSTPFGTADVNAILAAAGIPRVGISPNIADLSSPVAYATSAGGVGVTLMMAPVLANAGYKKIYAIGFDNPQLDALPNLLAATLAANGAEWVGLSKMAMGTTDFQQFILAAEAAGADGVMLSMGENEAIQVLQAAQQVGTDLHFGASLGTFSRATVEAMGPIAEQLLFVGEMPPLTASAEEWPILANITEDLAASGKDLLEQDRVTHRSMRSWLSVYMFVTIVEQYGDVQVIANGTPAEGRAAVTAAMDAAADVDSFGLIPPWTPNAKGGFAAFDRISQPWYFQVGWDGDGFVVDDAMLNVNEEMSGNATYGQPAR